MCCKVIVAPWLEYKMTISTGARMVASLGLENLFGPLSTNSVFIYCSTTTCKCTIFTRIIWFDSQNCILCVSVVTTCTMTVSPVFERKLLQGSFNHCQGVKCRSCKESILYVFLPSASFWTGSGFYEPYGRQKSTFECPNVTFRSYAVGGTRQSRPRLRLR